MRTPKKAQGRDVGELRGLRAGKSPARATSSVGGSNVLVPKFAGRKSVDALGASASALVDLIEEGMGYEKRVSSWPRWNDQGKARREDILEYINGALQDSLMVLALRKAAGVRVPNPINADGSLSEVLEHELLERLPHSPKTAHKLLHHLNSEVKRQFRKSNALSGAWGTIEVKSNKLVWRSRITELVVAPKFTGWTEPKIFDR